MLSSKFFNTNNTYFNHTALRSNSISENEGYPVATNFRAKTLYKVLVETMPLFQKKK